LLSRVQRLIDAIRDGDDALVEDAVLRLSRSRRWLAPLALAVGAFVMLFEALRLIVTNWRLTLIQVLPAMWIWVALLDLKAHALHGRSFHALRGPIVIPLVLLVTAITMASFFLNAVFAFAIANPGRPEIRPGFERAKDHLRVILASGGIVGLCLGLVTIVVTRWGRPWFGISLSIVIGVMMICYVAVPSRLIGVKPAASRRDKLAASAVSGALGTAVCTPPYVLARVGILMLGSRALLIPGIFIIAVGFLLQAGATGAIKAIKMSASLLGGGAAAVGTAAPEEESEPLPAHASADGSAAEGDAGG
jgi:hypothetical protein